MCGDGVGGFTSWDIYMNAGGWVCMLGSIFWSSSFMLILVNRPPSTPHDSRPHPTSHDPSPPGAPQRLFFSLPPIPSSPLSPPHKKTPSLSIHSHRNTHRSPGNRTAVLGPSSPVFFSEQPESHICRSPSAVLPFHRPSIIPRQTNPNTATPTPTVKQISIPHSLIACRSFLPDGSQGMFH